MKFREWKRRGQVMVLWALLTPLLICFVGAGMDLGWYYLNVSRLQNAADAAALAGSIKVEEVFKTLAGTDESKLYYRTTLVDPPSDLYNYEKISLENLSNYYKNINLTEGKRDANEYANKNLNANYDKNSSDIKSVTDSWDTSNKNKNVKFTPALYAREIDTQKNVRGSLYYGVELSEDITHLFLRGFKPMKATVTAYVLLNPHDYDLKSKMDKLDREEVIANWEYLNRHKDTYTGKWNHYQNNDTKVSYNKNEKTVYRTENITVAPKSKDLHATSANNNHEYKEDEVDSLNIDFKAEVLVKSGFTADWDIGQGNPTSLEKYQNSTDWTKNDDAALYRIHSSITFDRYKTRSSHTAPDPLWVRIESEPIITVGSNRSFNSVRQIILNMNADNTKTEWNGTDYRPLVIFYDGPEQLDKSTDKRISQPVVINLNENFNGIIYMPNSPVIIRGNEKIINDKKEQVKFTGFVIAKEFRKLAEESDILDGKTIADVYGNKHTPSGYTVLTTGYGDKFFVQTLGLGDKFLDEAAFNTKYKDREIVTDAKGNVSVYKETTATKYPIVSLKKAEAQKYNSLPEYLASDYYKEKFMSANGLTESQITTVTLPNSVSLPVKSSDISAKKVNDNYVSVGTNQYIDKNKLPYIKFRRNGVRPYISIYDLSTVRADGYYGLNTIDDSMEVHDGSTYDSSADIWRPTTDTWQSDMFIKKTLMDNTYSKNYIDSKLEVKDGYFMFIAEILEMSSQEQTVESEYWKVTDKNGAKKYLNKTVTIDYTETIPEGSDPNNEGKNPIIVDSKGNLQLKEKPLSDPSYNATRPTKNDEHPFNKDNNIDTDDSEKPDNGARISDWNLEYVYESDKAFNLSTASRYYSFEIAGLRHKVYTYLDNDSVDMFFTTARAEWLD